MAALNALPNELLALVANHLDRPRDVVNLALTCGHLNAFVKLDGWKAFLRGRFGLLGLDADAKNTVQGLTRLYRNWDRKAFTARYLEPGANVTSLNSGERKRWRGPQGQSQTMGYHPHIDSYEEMYDAWADRREVLAWSAGTSIVLRVKETGSNAARVLQEMSVDPDGPYEPAMFMHPNAWYTYQIPHSSEGRDDITALNILRPHQKNTDSEVVVFGTASGRLSTLTADLEQAHATEQLYDTNRQAVGSISVSSASDPLIATTLGDASLALYPVLHDQESENHIEPLSQVRSIPEGLYMGRVWSCSFISNDKVAVGLGPTYEPIRVYEITTTGFGAKPLREFTVDSQACEGIGSAVGSLHRTSVYPIIPIPHTGSEAGNVFLSGGYDGLIRLHDMRSPRGFETAFWDVTNDSSIYSLACQGLERVVAGSSMHSMLKVFDLRVSGSHTYHAIPIPSSNQPRVERRDYTYNTVVDDFQGNVRPIRGGWNVFLNPRKPPQQNGARRPRTGPRIQDSPVYSLSIPSPTSPNLYAGLEATVQNLNFVSVLDTHPDPLIASWLTYLPDSRQVDVEASYNPFGDVLDLGMYEQGDERGLAMQLLTQDSVGPELARLARSETRREFAKRTGLDERWMDPREDGKKWARGQQVPQGPQMRGGGRGRGRRRGRGSRQP